jgi:hypothetical protein
MFHRPGFRVCYLAIFPDVWMKSSQQGKLLAGAAGFYSPWGNESEEQGPSYFAQRFFYEKKGNASHRPPVPAFRLTPIRVREKRMNTYKTAQTGRSYQNINKSYVKKVLQAGTYFVGGRITNQELQSSSNKFIGGSYGC